MLTRIISLLWKAATGDPFARYRVAERLARLVSKDCAPGEYGRSWPRDEEFARALRPFEGPGNLRALDRKWMLRELLKLARGVEGDTAECGTWRGGSSWIICQGLGRPHHAFDSFEGLPEPGPGDGGHFRRGDLAEPEATFRARMGDFPGLRVYKGWIPSRFGEVADRRFSLVHIDVDLEGPTRDSVEFFYPRLSPGGILLLDDYGFFICPGARRAIDDFFRDKPEPVLEVPTGQGLVFKAGLA